MITKNIVDLIGNTPLIKLRHASQELEAIMPNGYEREMIDIKRSISART